MNQVESSKLWAEESRPIRGRERSTRTVEQVMQSIYSIEVASVHADCRQTPREDYFYGITHGYLK